jgi:hypothetical protein
MNSCQLQASAGFGPLLGPSDAHSPGYCVLRRWCRLGERVLTRRASTRLQVSSPDFGEPTLGGVRAELRPNPVQGSETTCIVVHEERAVRLEHQQAHRLGKTGGQAACVEHFAASNDETHRQRTVLSASDMPVVRPKGGGPSTTGARSARARTPRTPRPDRSSPSPHSRRTAAPARRPDRRRSNPPTGRRP